MWHHSQHRHAGSWQEHLFLGPQAAGLRQKQVIEEPLIQKKIDCFPSFPWLPLRDLSLARTCCPGEFSPAASLPTAITFCHVVKQLISTFLLSQPVFQPGFPSLHQVNPGFGFFSVCLYSVLALRRLGGRRHRWLLTHVQQPAGLYQVLPAQRVLERPPGKGLRKVKWPTRLWWAPCRGFGWGCG